MDVATTIVGGVGTIGLFFGGIVIHGLRDDLSNLQETVSELQVSVGILLDRDRRRRLEDYEKKD